MSLQHSGSTLPTPEKLPFTIAEVCTAIGISKTDIYELIAEGKLKSIRAAGRRLLLRSDLEAFLTSCGEGAESERPDVRSTA